MQQFLFHSSKIVSYRDQTNKLWGESKSPDISTLGSRWQSAELLHEKEHVISFNELHSRGKLSRLISDVLAENQLSERVFMDDFSTGTLSVICESVSDLEQVLAVTIRTLPREWDYRIHNGFVDIEYTGYRFIRATVRIPRRVKVSESLSEFFKQPQVLLTDELELSCECSVIFHLKHLKALHDSKDMAASEAFVDAIDPTHCLPSALVTAHFTQLSRAIIMAGDSVHVSRNEDLQHVLVSVGTNGTIDDLLSSILTLRSAGQQTLADHMWGCLFARLEAQSSTPTLLASEMAEHIVRVLSTTPVPPSVRVKRFLLILRTRDLGSTLAAALTLTLLGRTCLIAGDVASAETYTFQAVETFGAVSLGGHAPSVSSLDATDLLAKIWIRRKKPSLAIPCYLRVLRGRYELLGFDSEDTMKAALDLRDALDQAASCADLKDVFATLFFKISEPQPSIVGESPPIPASAPSSPPAAAAASVSNVTAPVESLDLKLLIMSVHVGHFLHICGELAGAREMLTAARSSLLRCLNPTHPFVVTASLLLAEALADCGLFEEAAPLFREALDAIAGTADRPERAVSDDQISGIPIGTFATLRLSSSTVPVPATRRDRLVAWTKRYCEVCCELNPKDAVAAFESSIDRLKKLYLDDLDNVSFLSIIGQYARYLRLEGNDLAMAEALYIQIEEAVVRTHGEDHEAALVASLEVSVVLRMKGDLSAARDRLSRVLQIRQSQLGASHEMSLQAASRLASVLREMQLYKDAEGLLLRILDKRVSQLGSSHPDSIETMIDLGNLYNEIGNEKKARLLYSKATQARNAVAEDKLRTPAKTAELMQCQCPTM